MKLICANFKMNLLDNDIINYLNTIENKIKKENIIFFPSNIYIKHFSNKNYLVGSQNISFKEWGAVTGDTSIHQLKELGIKYTLIGHSERRKYFNDNDYISDKINIALKNNIKIVLCIGENEEEFIENKTFEVLKKELDEAISNNIDLINYNNLIIAYEPIWSIGTGKIPTNEILDITLKQIKDYLSNNYKLDLKVLYGGSVKLDNIEELESIKTIDGYLIGGASLDSNKFLELVNKIN